MTVTAIPTGAAQTIGLLHRFGPGARSNDAAAPPMSPEQARRYLHRLATTHYENFSVLTRLVPENLRDDFAAVYGFCRWADDLADETGHGSLARLESLELLSWWREELVRCFDFARRDPGRAQPEAPTHPVFIALADTIRRRELVDEPFHHLIDAFEQDQRVTRYQTWDQLAHYCSRSADPVGRIVLALAGHHPADPANAERVAMSDATCTALQLTNFWQDVRRDIFERDRIYLPFDETRLDAHILKNFVVRREDPAARIQYIRSVRPLVERTRELFVKGRPLPRTLDRRIRPVVWLFGAGGEAVLTSIERIGCATLWMRPTLSHTHKARLVAMAAILRLAAGSPRPQKAGAAA